MDDGIADREARLRRLPNPYSLALRLRDAGVDDDLICSYLTLEPEALPTFLRLAEAKLTAVQRSRHTSPHTTAPHITPPSAIPSGDV
jgi:hypothetical protein